MRLFVASIVILFVVACGKADRPEIEKIEIRQSGWQSEDVTIASTGLGNYHISEPYPEGQSGTFKMTHEQFVSLLSSLEPYRAEAEAYTDESALRFIKNPCPPKVTWSRLLGQFGGGVKLIPFVVHAAILVMR
ncbi:hypothetical protein [Novosphingobium resinovorum]|uniref:Lipoprotein n=1 Tax=Novosphingobium resinovorum TaxID=158500 RepID=A0A031JB59_9SPHN|nr:hypothetical protein [Novosphingobium resinovorum]EZP70468.1 hypothetical protein BV97_05431 [Novosphingobium resinovorum]